MRRTLVPLIALSTLLATALAAPVGAQANLYCVNKSPCLGGTIAADPQIALSLAQLQFGPDTVAIGPKATPYVGPFSYTGTDPVTVVGAGTGSGATILTAPGPVPTLTLEDPDSTVSNLRIEVPPGPNLGLELEGTASGVRVQEIDAIDGIGPATGVLLHGGAVFEQGSVAMNSGLGIGAGDPAHYAFIRDSTIRAPQGEGIWSGGRLSVARSTVESLGIGIQAGGFDADVDLADTVVRTTNGAGLRVDYGATATARHMTLLNDGAAERGIEIFAGAPGTGGPTKLTLTSSIVSGFPLTLYRQGIDAANPGNATLRYSAWDGSFEQTGAGTIDVATANLPNTTPVFVQRLSAPPTIVPNLHLRAPSPLIDAADPAAPAVDHDGAPREQDGDGDGVGRSDIGAFENVPPPAEDPAAPAPGAPETTVPVVAPAPLATDRTAPRLRGVSLSSRRLRFKLSEPATVTLRFAAASGEPKRRPLTLVVDGKAGVNRVRFAGRISATKSLAPGRYRLTLSAADAAGNRSPRQLVRSLELTGS